MLEFINCEHDCVENLQVLRCRYDYNYVRPHSSIGLKTPMEFMKSIGKPNQPMVH